MQRESTLGRVLWIALLIVLGAYVIADFVRSPFVAPSGSAAVRPAELTLWTPTGEASGETGLVVQDAAAGLELGGHATATKSLAGGSSQAVAEFLSRPPRDSGADLLVVTSATLADLAQDRRDRLVPGAAEEAALALALLRRATPVGLLESDPLAIGVDSGSSIRSTAQLLASLRATPSQRLFGIADDTWSRVELAAFVDRAGVDGNVRFSIFQTGAEAGQAVQTGAANTVLAPRGTIDEDVRAGRLRQLRWPFAGRPPRFWVAVVAPSGLPRSQVASLRRWIRGLGHDRGWRRQLRRSGRVPADPSAGGLTAVLRGGLASAGRLQLLAQRLENR
jgi:hypothetical protein